MWQSCSEAYSVQNLSRSLFFYSTRRRTMITQIDELNGNLGAPIDIWYIAGPCTMALTSDAPRIIPRRKHRIHNIKNHTPKALMTPSSELAPSTEMALSPSNLGPYVSEPSVFLKLVEMVEENVHLEAYVWDRDRTKLLPESTDYKCNASRTRYTSRTYARRVRDCFCCATRKVSLKYSAQHQVCWSIPVLTQTFTDVWARKQCFLPW